MSVRAKFRCHFKDEQNKVIRLSPVHSGSPENEKFFSYTPGGDIALWLGDKAKSAFDSFEQGKEYYVDFAEAVPPGESPYAPHQLRVIQERKDLGDKLDKLRAFIGQDLFKTLPVDEQDRLKQQFDFMNSYYGILNKRIAAF